MKQYKPSYYVRAGGFPGPAYMKEDPNGGWVKWEDVQKESKSGDNNELAHERRQTQTIRRLCLPELYEVPDKADNINHPPHYTTGKIEVIDFITDKKLNYCRGNIIKYVVRAGIKSKETELDDLKKARWYIDREIKRMEGKV